MILYVADWFLHLPPALRPVRQGAHFDRGRKAHADPDQAAAHYDQLLQAGLAAVQAAAGDQWDRRAASLQRVELVQVTLPDPDPQLLVALLDDLWATPGRRTYPWRLDDQRRPWTSQRRVLRHWSAPMLREDDHP